MSTVKDNFVVNIDAVLDRFKKAVGLRKNYEIAELLGISSPDFSKRKKSGSVLNLILEYALNSKLSLDWIYFGIGGSDSKINVADPDKTSSELKSFKNRKEAEQVISMLKRMEDIDERQFFRVVGKIETELEILEKAPGEASKKDMLTGT